jgi:hypothetical protein
MDNPWQNFPGGNPFPYSSNPATAKFTAAGAYMPLRPDLKTTTVYNWNLGVQRQVTPGLFASASYVGNHAIHMWNLVELNPPEFLGLGPCTINTVTGPTSYSVCSTTANTNQRRRLNRQNPIAAQNISFITEYNDSGTQNYHGLILNTTLRAARNVKIRANYTWSHCIGDATERCRPVVLAV